ncbi:hypothetical protein RhiirA1_400140 [Rhizophagus irregularis]|uniref:Uncharacterized protein n=1 Tax=Rhizophagus irregularis TaxID=588596 RepID=A0A2N0R7B8_9GLOM|nr:hypothetical protein RhiirA1_400140 [Rhizophagus irregularis]
MDSSPDSTTPPPISQAILRLYKPQKILDVSMRISKLSPYLSCDTRGSGTLYNTKKGRYYLIRLSEKADLPLTEINKYLIYTNDIELSKNHRHTFRSTSNKPNLNYILGIYLTFVFSLNRQFHKDVVNKYFNRLCHLLKEKLLALRNRLESTDNNDRKTKTFIRFSCGHHVIYLGFYFPCGTLHFEPDENTGYTPTQRSDIYKNSPNGHMYFNQLRERRRIKNWIRRTKKRNRLKKQLPPLPAGFVGDQRTYYYDTYNINLFDYNIRRRYNVSRIPQYNYGYSKAVELYRQHHDKYVTVNFIQPPPNVSYHIKKNDQDIFNDPNLFFWRTPPPDNNSHTTMSDISYFSASEGPSVVEFLPTPLHD